jgi:hypothetical protein
MTETAIMISRDGIFIRLVAGKKRVRKGKVGRHPGYYHQNLTSFNIISRCGSTDSSFLFTFSSLAQPHSTFAQLSRFRMHLRPHWADEQADGAASRDKIKYQSPTREQAG